MSADHTLAPWLQRQLESLLHQRGHALLLTGPSGLGQYELGLALARAWLCDQPTPQGACGQCESCHGVNVRTHPDLCALMPETLSLELDWPLDESTQKDLDEKKRKPSKWIRVEAARQVVGFAQMTRSRGSTKVVLVYPAERLNVESANTLLKTLEEPQGDLRFVLATGAAHSLLPTIRSRCQTHALQWPDASEALAWLEQQAQAHGIKSDAEQREVCLAAAGGRPSDALAWMAAGLQPSPWQGIPQAVARGDWGLLSDWEPARQLTVLQQLCHDLMAQASGAEPRYFAPSSLPTPPRWAVLATWAKELSEAAKTVEHPYSAGLLQEAWAARAKSLLSSRPPERASR